jgi:FSR family fosmidomycin resistance protein-like MFS transporter
MPRRQAIIGSRRLWVLTAAHTTNDMYGGAVRALLPFFTLYAGYSYVQVAGITLAVTALSSISQPLFGWLSDRYGLRWMSLAGLLASGTGVALSGLLVGSYGWVCVVVALTGLGSAAYHPSATMEARVVGGGTSGAMSLFSVGGNLGAALAPTAVVLVVGLGGLGWTTLLVIPALVMGAVYTIVTRRADRARSASPAPRRASQGELPTDDWRAFAWLTVVLVTWSVANISTSTFISLYSIERFHTTAAESTVALTVLAVAGAVGTLAGGWLADRFGRLRIVRIGYLLAIASTAGILLAPDLAFLYVATLCLGFTLFLPFAAHITLSHSYLPRRIGMASGVALGLTFSIGGFVSPLFGVIAEQSGVGAVFGIVGGLIVLGLGLSLLLRERAQAAPIADDIETEQEIADHS